MITDAGRRQLHNDRFKVQIQLINDRDALSNQLKARENAEQAIQEIQGRIEAREAILEQYASLLGEVSL